MGAITPAGADVGDLWAGVISGNSFIKPLAEISSSSLFGQHTFLSDSVAEIAEDAFRREVENLPEEFRHQDRYIQIAAIAARQALSQADAQVVISKNPERTGVVVSTAISGTKQMETEFLVVTNGGVEDIDPANATPYLYLASMSSTPAHMLATLIGATGPAYALSTGCIGGIDAFGAAFEEIASGECDMVVCGAAEAPITPVTVAAFEVIGCLSQNFHGDAQRASRPFDAKRNGFVLGEGAAFFVLEDLDHALARGASPLAEVTSFASTANALHMTDLVNEGVDLSRALDDAVREAGLEARDIDYVSAHGSSTPQNDRFETRALRNSLGSHADDVPVSSAKSMLGHALSAASAIELVLCAQALQKGWISGTANYEYPDPECDLDYVVEGAREWRGNTILKGASGFAGLHAATTLRRWEADHEG